MNKAGIIRQIGQTIDAVDVLRGSLDSDSAERKTLDAQRKELSERRKILTKESFDEGANKYKKITAKISRINSKLKNFINRAEKIKETVTNLARLLRAIDELLKISAKLVA